MSVAVCITVFNEEETIGKLLDSLLKQGKKPKEIVIVDAVSKDKTVEIIKHYQKKDKRIKLLREPGNVAHGRNTSIEVAKGSVIVHIDAGCVAREDWLEKITDPFKHEEIDVVAGFYQMKAKTPLQYAMNVYHGVPPQRFDITDFLPSARSLAFRKRVWEEVGGYSEKLEKSGEDTLFIYEAVERGFNMVPKKDAIVDWNETGQFSFKDSLRKYYQYGKGDAQAGFWLSSKKQSATHNIKISGIFIRYIVGFVLLILAFFEPSIFLVLVILLILYLAWSILRWCDVIRGWQARFWLPVVQISSDIVVLTGFISGKIVK